mmetsp:Transcript_20127/g.60013  ORF Transcript_20127/g.60013 Transcript_20127/m.60013 type:complete len:305 (-) Transcript_20127:1674-2588(-)
MRSAHPGRWLRSRRMASTSGSTPGPVSSSPATVLSRAATSTERITSARRESTMMSCWLSGLESMCESRLATSSVAIVTVSTRRACAAAASPYASVAPSASATSATVVPSNASSCGSSAAGSTPRPLSWARSAARSECCGRPATTTPAMRTACCLQRSRTWASSASSKGESASPPCRPANCEAASLPWTHTMGIPKASASLADSSMRPPDEKTFSTGRDTSTKSRPLAYARYLVSTFSTSSSSSLFASSRSASSRVTPNMSRRGTSSNPKTSRMSVTFRSCLRDARRAASVTYASSSHTSATVRK